MGPALRGFLCNVQTRLQTVLHVAWIWIRFPHRLDPPLQVQSSESHPLPYSFGDHRSRLPLGASSHEYEALRSLTPSLCWLDPALQSQVCRVCNNTWMMGAPPRPWMPLLSRFAAVHRSWYVDGLVMSSSNAREAPASLWSKASSVRRGHFTKAWRGLWIKQKTQRRPCSMWSRSQSLAGKMWI